MKKLAKITAVVLVAIMAVAVLVACGPASNPDKAIASLERRGYTNPAKDEVLVKLPLKERGVKGIETVVIATKSVKDGDNSKLESVTIIYFDSAASASDAYSVVEGFANSHKTNNDDWIVEQSGRMIYYGTSQAIKDAR